MMNTTASRFTTSRRVTGLWTLLAAGIFLTGLPLAAQTDEASPDESSVSNDDAGDAAKLPPALTHYLGREIAATMHYTGAPWLIRESRQREEDCETMLRELQLKPGMVVCDMGCGNGFYSLQMGQAVGDTGEVLAVDIQPEMLRLLERRAKKDGIENIRPVLGTLVDPMLPEGKVDLILCVDVYHEFSHPVQMLSAMRSALKPQGQIVMVEFRSEDPNVPIKRLHKMSKRQVRKEMAANGLKESRSYDGLPWQHMLFFERDDDWQPPPSKEILRSSGHGDESRNAAALSPRN